MCKAKVQTVNGSKTPNGQEKIARLRMGEKGKGRVLGVVVFWPWSPVSCDQADKIIFEIAEREGVEVVTEE